MNIVETAEPLLAGPAAGDIFEALEASYLYLTEHGLSQGRRP